MVPNQELGKQGEDAAVAFLKKKGYQILARNVRTPSGELDIVAEHDSQVVFVEVKTRTRKKYGHPWEAVNKAKQKKLALLAKIYISKNRLQNKVCRFDVIGVIPQGDSQDTWDIALAQDAFRM